MSGRSVLPKSFFEAILVCTQSLRSDPSIFVRQSAEAEAEQLVSAAYRKVTGVSLTRFDLLLRAKEAYPLAAAELLLVWCASRREGKLLQHLTGYQVFFDHEYEVSPQVLIPRPETECLVLTVIQWLDAQGWSPSIGMEVGLGSGAISIELLSRWKGLQMLASELSSGAIECALRNAARILGEDASGVGRLKVLKVDSGENVLEPFLGFALGADFLVTNPPYLTRSLNEVEVDVMAHEPHLALFAPDSDPFFFYRKIATEGKFFLKSNGVVFAELPHERALPIVEIFQKEGWNTELVLDLSQRNRVMIAQRD